MARLIAAHPWDTHPLGPPDHWSQSLKNALVLLLECRLPMYLAWGPDLLQFYNDAYRPILGDKHEGALGGSARDTWSFGGLGLGLSIVHHLVQLHGGSVSVESPGSGAGATFRVTLPLHHVNSNVSPKPPATFYWDTAPDLAGRMVLVVDDDPDSRELLKRVIEECGAEVHTAPDAYAAMNFIELRAPDVLCSDIGMPGMDGYELVRWVRALPGNQQALIPAIAMTAFARPEDEARSLESGFDVHLSKPVDPSQVLAAIGRLLSSVPNKKFAS